MACAPIKDSDQLSIISYDYFIVFSIWMHVLNILWNKQLP